MHIRIFRGARDALVVACALAAGAGTPVRADDASAANPLELRRIMQAMSRNMQAVTDAISREDWAEAARIAPLIAEHPQPPVGEKVRILAFMGADAGRFRGHDEKTHQAADALAQAAQRGDGPAVITSFATLQGACLGCHQAFRKPFVEHFYRQR